MQLGFIGLGRLGAELVDRLHKGGHDVVSYGIDPPGGDVGSLGELVQQLRPRRYVWTALPLGGPTDRVIEALSGMLDPDDLVVDVGNCRWTDNERRAVLLGEQGIAYVDCGVSGGVWGSPMGYALMVGGSREDVEELMPAFDTLKVPGAGFVHAGPVGAGQFAKMVHNGVAYALLQAYHEGFALLAANGSVRDIPGVLSSWTAGTVVQSSILDLAVGALTRDPELSRLHGFPEDVGEGRWCVEAAIAYLVATPAIAAALQARFSSRAGESPATEAIAALRRHFDGSGVGRAFGPVAGEADHPGPTEMPPLFGP